MKVDESLYYMKLAAEEAEKAYQIGEVPVGAILVDDSGKIVSRAHNLKEQNHNPAGHAEIELLINAGRELKTWRLIGHTLVVTLEPCLMCMGAMVHARIDRLIFGAYDKKAGALSLGYHIHNDPRLNHKFEVIGGLDHYQCSKRLSQFFRERRRKS